MIHTSANFHSSRYVLTLIYWAMTLSLFQGWGNLHAATEISLPFPGHGYRPDQTGNDPLPGIFLLHGSEGGNSDVVPFIARSLADLGFQTVAYCYYGCPGTPEALKDVDLFQSYQAFEWLVSSSLDNKAAIVGFSRGAEQALLLSALTFQLGLKTPSAIAVHAPHEYIIPAFFPENVIRDCYLPEPYCAAAWRWQDDFLNGKLYALKPIPVESIECPVFLSHGAQDQLWPAMNSLNIAKKLLDKNREVDLHIWSGEGHVLTLDSWNQMTWLMVEFLKKAMKL